MVDGFFMFFHDPSSNFSIWEDDHRQEAAFVSDEFVNSISF